MNTPRWLKDAAQFEYVCADCGRRLREGDQFVIVGTMTSAILHGCITNTLAQVEFLGRMRCAACAKALA